MNGHRFILFLVASAKLIEIQFFNNTVNYEVNKSPGFFCYLLSDCCMLGTEEILKHLAFVCRTSYKFGFSLNRPTGPI